MIKVSQPQKTVAIFIPENMATNSAQPGEQLNPLSAVGHVVDTSITVAYPRNLDWTVVSKPFRHSALEAAAAIVQVTMWWSGIEAGECGAVPEAHALGRAKATKCGLGHGRVALPHSACRHGINC